MLQEKEKEKKEKKKKASQWGRQEEAGRQAELREEID